MKNSAIGSNWKDVRAELFTKEEILESDLRSRDYDRADRGSA